jgi:hypothetical protein
MLAGGCICCSGRYAARAAAFAAAGIGAGPRQDRQLVEHDRHVFHEHRVRHRRIGVEPLDAVAGRGQRPLVGGVLRPRQLEVDRHARLKRQLACRQPRADRPRDGDRFPHARHHSWLTFQMAEFRFQVQETQSEI